ncbi:MAG: ATP-binding cassette domain-containing protein, partial [Actinomycetota bacterium]
MMRRWRWVLPAAAVLVVGLALLLVTADAEVVVEPLRVEAGSQDDEVALDAALYLPPGASAEDPRPAVLLGHGFLSDRTAVDGPARSLADAGYVVLTWSSRGFGASGGDVAIAAPGREIADVAALVDLLAARPEVRNDAADDPRVAIAGSSYGGGTALLAATAEPRLDAVVALAAWHSLTSALAPNGVVDPGPGGDAPAAGVVKTAWTGLLFTARATPGLLSGPPGGGAPDAGTGPPAGGLDRPADDEAATGSIPDDALARPPAGSTAPSPCGRFSPEVCDAYLAIATAGTMTPEAAELLEASSPVGELGRVTAPTLLVQGQDDTLFDLAQAVANADAIAAAGTPVRQRWVPGGHQQVAFGAGNEEIDQEVRAWLDRWLDDPTGAAATGQEPTGTSEPVLVWTDAVTDEVIDAERQQTTGVTLRLALTPDGRLTSGPAATDDQGGGSVPAARTIFSPPGGQPAALSTLPGTGGLGDLLPSADIAGQHVAFIAEAQDQDLVLFGAPNLGLTLDADGDEARVFVKLSDLAPDGRTRLLQQAVTPVRATNLPATVTVELPVLAHRLRAGHRLRLTVATTDQAFDNLTEPTTVTLGLDEEAVLTLPTAEVAATSTRASPILIAVLVVLVVLSLLGAGLLSRRRGRDVEPEREGTGGQDQEWPHADPASDRAGADGATPPVALSGLGKRYPDGKVAVDDLTLEVGSGQVMGLLGPNGAGKTSALRMLVGLAHPTTGGVELFGHRVRPGHPVLTRVGALIEGPGFVPELSGRENLELYWRAGGQALEDADLPWALDIAALGEAIDNPVKTYSHGMKQRLAIAQAMLGRPELLVLDEPTDGLDPEQIRTMRRLLVQLGEEGHTIVVSSHLLAEVEQMCTHVAVMQSGRLRAIGPVATLTGTTARVTISTDDGEAARRVLAAAVDDGEVTASEDTVVVAGSEVAVADLVELLVADGIRIDAVAPRGSLEDAFLSLTAT